MGRENEAAACFAVLQGALGYEWSDYLGGLTIASSSVEGRVTTILTGQVVDFAAFVGLISHLQNLGLTVQTITFHSLPAAQLS